MKSKLEIEIGEMQIISLLEINLDSIISEITSILKIKGEINLYSSQHIKECIEDFVNKGKKIFFIDLSEVSYIDSSGLGAFLSIHSKIYKSGGGVHLCAPSPKVNYVLELTKLKGLLNVFSSLEEGIDSVKNKK